MTGEELANAAHEALQRGELESARALFADAAGTEALAYRSIDLSKPRTKGVLAVSAASLWYKAGRLEAAEQLAHDALALSGLPLFAQQELRELLQVVWNQRAQHEAGLSFASGQVLVSVRGGEVVAGGAPLDLIIGKVQIVQNIFYRTVEYLINAPLRLRGPAPKAIQERYRPWLFQSVPGSYQFVVAVQTPDQADLFSEGDINTAELTTKFLDIVRACSDDPVSTLPSVVEKPEYRETFLKMTRNLAPSGRSFSQMELRGGGDRGPVLLSSESRRMITATLRPVSSTATTAPAEISLRGNLRALDLDKDWLEIAVHGETMRVSGLSEAVDDVIGPMVNHDVTVQARRGQGRQLLFIDIELMD